MKRTGGVDILERENTESGSFMPEQQLIDYLLPVFRRISKYSGIDG